MAEEQRYLYTLIAGRHCLPLEHVHSLPSGVREDELLSAADGVIAPRGSVLSLTRAEADRLPNKVQPVGDHIPEEAEDEDTDDGDSGDQGEGASLNDVPLTDTARARAAEMGLTPEAFEGRTGSGSGGNFTVADVTEIASADDSD